MALFTRLEDTRKDRFGAWWCDLACGVGSVIRGHGKQTHLAFIMIYIVSKSTPE